MTAMQTVRTSVPPNVFSELDYRAEQAGVTLSRYVRQVLTAHTLDQDARGVAPTTVTPLQWADLREWVALNPGKWATYAGPRTFRDNQENRVALYSWALENGFTPA